MANDISARLKNGRGSGERRGAGWIVGGLIAASLFGAGELRSQQQPQAQKQQSQDNPQLTQQSPPEAQSPSKEPLQQGKIAVEAKEVTLYATVRDKHGKTVADLNKENFVLDEDGRAQKITYFARESDLPLTLGLLVDTSLSQRRVLDKERDASSDFLDHLLREDKDKAFLIHFDHEVELLKDLTSSRAKLRAALNLLETPQLERASGDGGGRGQHGAGTLLYDAIFLASNEEMQKQKGRKALILLTDGVDRGSKETIGSAIEAAQKADTSVFSILFSDDEGYDRDGGFGGHGGHGGGGPGRRYPQQDRPDGKKVLERISKETGGEFLQVSKKTPIDQIYKQIEDGLRSQYSLGYTPDRASADPGYHKIHLATNQKDLVVQARDGYYSEK
jgi:VWFA-related protein